MQINKPQRVREREGGSQQTAGEKQRSSLQSAPIKNGLTNLLMHACMQRTCTCMLSVSSELWVSQICHSICTPGQVCAKVYLTFRGAGFTQSTLMPATAIAVPECDTDNTCGLTSTRSTCPLPILYTWARDKPSSGNDTLRNKARKIAAASRQGISDRHRRSIPARVKDCKRI